MPCTAVPVSLFGLPATFKFMATAARWRAACVKRRAAHFGENWVGVVPRMVEGGVRGGRVAHTNNLQQLCAKVFSLLAIVIVVVVTICVFCLRTFWHYFSATAATPPIPPPPLPHANKFKYALCARRLNKFASS